MWYTLVYRSYPYINSKDIKTRKRDLNLWANPKHDLKVDFNESSEHVMYIGLLFSLFEQWCIKAVTRGSIFT